jgi:hypothetical protein
LGIINSEAVLLHEIKPDARQNKIQNKHRIVRVLLSDRIFNSTVGKKFFNKTTRLAFINLCHKKMTSSLISGINNYFTFIIRRLF